MGVRSGVLDFQAIELGHEEALRAVLGPATDRPIIVDLAEVEFCSASGLGMLLRATEHLRRAATPVSLAYPQPSVARLFTLAGTNLVLPVLHDPGQADRTPSS